MTALSDSPPRRYGLGFLTVALTLLTITFLSCYLLWIKDGCSPWMPFISDLGIHGLMRLIFVAGLSSSALHLIGALVAVSLARRRLLRRAQAGVVYHALNAIVAVIGAAGSLALGTIGFYPWDRDWAFRRHMNLALAIFNCGTVWAIGNAMLMSRLGRADFTKDSGCRAFFQLVQCALAVTSVASLVLMNRNFYLGDLGPDLHQARTDFQKFCSSGVGQGRRPATALFEWVLVSSLLAHAATVLPDLDLDARLRSAERDAPDDSRKVAGRGSGESSSSEDERCTSAGP